MESGAGGVNVEAEDITVDSEGRVVVQGELAQELQRLKNDETLGGRGRIDVDLNWKCR